MPKITALTHQVQLTKAHLRLIAEFVEVTHRAICGQYKPLFDLIQRKTEAHISYNQKDNLELLCLDLLQPKLRPNESYSGTFEPLGYQTYRDILEFLEQEYQEENPQPESVLKSVYSWKQDQIANEPKLKISKL